MRPIKKTNLRQADVDKSPTPAAPEQHLDVFFHLLNRSYQAQLAKLTFGISPAAVGSAWSAWFFQLMQSPGHLLGLASYPILHVGDHFHHMVSDENNGLSQDVRFHEPSWNTMPWNFYAESFLQVEAWWQRAIEDVPGVSKTVERALSFSVRQVLDAVSPSNFVFSNPNLFYESQRQGGMNLWQGAQIAYDHWLTRLAGLPPPGAEHFIPGKDVAITPGRVVFKNHLIELLQYEPQTKTVFKEPILILPAWIMKYYILDLSPHNSLVKWLVAQGHTVFIVSWLNPGQKDRNLSMDDYYRLGALAALDAIRARIPRVKIHLVGYCLGGTLAMIAAAAIRKQGKKFLKSLSLLAAQGDFTEAGDLTLFMTESEVSYLENMMWDQGYLDTKQMAGSFQMLRSYDLIWSKMVDDYMTGKERGMVDLLAWNADATRMPYKMHSEYLEKLFLKNQFAAGKYKVGKELVVPQDIDLPIFAVSAEQDHVAPWKSVFKIHLMTQTDVCFVLTKGGHNAGIVSEPKHPKRFFLIHQQKRNLPYIGPKKWLSIAEKRDGSWWLAWHEWLVKHSSSTRVDATALESNLPAAPGRYVMQK
jgi:polyhydroxyalkanoate synthase